MSIDIQSVLPGEEKWEKAKPTMPGRYEIRWANRIGIMINDWCVTVKRRGKGLSVVPDPPFNTSYPMSDFKNNEVEWRKIGPSSRG